MGEGKCHFLKQPKLKATSALLYVERSQGELRYLLGLLHGREAKPFCLDSQLFHILSGLFGREELVVGAAVSQHINNTLNYGWPSAQLGLKG